MKLKLITAAQAARLAGCSKAWITLLARRGIIEGARRPSGWIVSEASVRAWSRERKSRFTK